MHICITNLNPSKLRRYKIKKNTKFSLFFLSPFPSSSSLFKRIQILPDKSCEKSKKAKFKHEFHREKLFSLSFSSISIPRFISQKIERERIELDSAWSYIASPLANFCSKSKKSRKKKKKKSFDSFFLERRNFSSLLSLPFDMCG